MSVFPAAVEAAIAIDSSENGGYSGAGTSLTYAHTVTGSNTILIVAVVLSGGGDRMGTVQYNSVSATLVNKQAAAGVNNYMYEYYLIAPTSGTNNIVVQPSSGNGIGSGAESLTGAKQSAQPDANNTGTDTGTGTSNSTITTVAANTWLVAFYTATLATPTAGTGTFARVSPVGEAGDQKALFDSNGTVGAGSNQLQATGVAENWAWNILSVAPIATAATTKAPFSEF